MSDQNNPAGSPDQVQPQADSGVDPKLAGNGESKIASSPGQTSLPKFIEWIIAGAVGLVVVSGIVTGPYNSLKSEGKVGADGLDIIAGTDRWPNHAGNVNEAAATNAGVSVSATNTPRSDANPFYTVRGRVLDDGQPVANALVWCVARDDESNYPLNLSNEAIKQIADTGGVIGVILFPHWLRQPDQQIFGADGFPLVSNTIQHIADVVGFEHIAIGSDLDGFIAPVKGCETYAQTPALVSAIEARFPHDADKILFGNVLRVLNAGWKGAYRA
jgi:hypothetical protein